MGGGGGEAGGEAGPARPRWLGGGCSWHRLCLFFREWPPLGCGVAAPLRPSPADSPLIDSGGARRGPGAGPGRCEPGRLPTPLGLSPPEPPTLHPFPQRIGRRPAGGRGAGAASSPPPFSGLFFLQLFFSSLGSSSALSLGVLAQARCR